MNCWPAVREHRTVAGIAVNLLLREFSISTSRVDFHEYSDASPVINTLSSPRIFRACAVSVYQALFYEGLGTRLGRGMQESGWTVFTLSQHSLVIFYFFLPTFSTRSFSKLHWFYSQRAALSNVLYVQQRMRLHTAENKRSIIILLY